MCSTLRAIADLGLTVVAVIHQPRLEIFNTFDDLLLLAPGGVTTFIGHRCAYTVVQLLDARQMGPTQ